MFSVRLLILCGVCHLVEVKEVLLENDTKGKSNIRKVLLMAYKFSYLCVWV